MANQKRTLKNLVAEEKRKLIYLRNSEVCADFFKMAEKEEFHFGSLPSEKWVSDNFIAIHSDGEMGHPPYFVRAKLNSDSREIVDFEKYVSGENDYSYVKD